MTKHFKDLIAWQKSMDLVEEIYRITNCLPKTEMYGLSDQMRRAAVSIPSNIAEGQQRHTKNEFVRFLAIARGSSAELETQLLICNRLAYLDSSQTEHALSLCSEVGKMLNGLIQKQFSNQ